jgi:nickel-dependent lactate racemase
VRAILAYGSRPYPIDLGAREARVLSAPELPAPAPLDDLLDRALAAPIGAPLPRLAPGARVTVIVSDPTRAEPRAAFLRALRRHLPGGRWTIAVASGTHGACDLDALGLGKLGECVNHDGQAGIVELGTTARGTPVRVHRCLVEADLVIATGCIRPHYFAGFGAGAKALFPGLGESTAIRINHRLKTAPGSRAGIVDGNPCREDLEEAVRQIPTPMFLLDAVAGPDDRIHVAVAGDVFAAFRSGADLARPWFTVRTAPAPLVIASDALPVTATLYQAAKIGAAAAPLVEPGGTLAIVAECADGVGPLDTVNEAIFRIGVLPRLPGGARLVLVSSLDAATVARTLVTHARSVQDLLAAIPGRVVVVPRASQLICEATS